MYSSVWSLKSSKTKGVVTQWGLQPIAGSTYYWNWAGFDPTTYAPCEDEVNSPRTSLVGSWIRICLRGETHNVLVGVANNKSGQLKAQRGVVWCAFHNQTSYVATSRAGDRQRYRGLLEETSTYVFLGSLQCRVESTCSIPLHLLWPWVGLRWLPIHRSANIWHI